MIKLLHLSDIHIPKEYLSDQDFKTMKTNMKKDIEKHVKDIGKIDVLVFSGDLVDRGNVALQEKAGKDFIEEMAKAAGIPNENIIMVPGNHDAERPKGMVADKISKFRRNCEGAISKDELGFLIKRFEKFNSMYQSVNGSIKSSYGVSDLTLDTGDVYRFIRLNSALASRDDGDYNNLFISKVQLDEIMNDINEEVRPIGLEKVFENIFEYANEKLKFKNFNFIELGEK